MLRGQVGVIPFALGAVMFYVLLYRSRLAPRWLSPWGLVGAVLYLIPALGSMFGLSLGILMAPLALQEMVMAVWLIAKGYALSGTAIDPSAETPIRPAATPFTAPAT